MNDRKKRRICSQALSTKPLEKFFTNNKKYPVRHEEHNYYYRYLVMEGEVMLGSVCMAMILPSLAESCA